MNSRSRALLVVLLAAIPLMCGVAGASEDYRRSLRGVNATWMDFSNLTGGYGAAHCCTQVLHRSPPVP